MITLPVYDPFWGITALRVFVILHVMAFAAWPWFTRLFSSLKDRGAGMAMAGGIFIYLLTAQAWWRTGLFEFRFVWTALLLIGIGISGRTFFSKPVNPSCGTRSNMRKSFLQGWLVFTILFWLWAGIRVTDPGVTHTEQPMDVMWMNAALSSSEPPIQDAWFGGAPASYYSDGHQALALLGVLFGLPIQQSVNLTQTVWFALTGLLAFQAAKALYGLSGKRGGGLAGSLAVLFICFISTPTGFSSAMERNDGVWWWKASRILKDGSTELITEFPFFSFWVGDNHAHVIGLPFLLLAIVASVQLFRIKRISYPAVFLSSVLVFMSWRMNPWQTPTVLALPILGLFLRRRKLTAAEVKIIGLAWLPGLLFLTPPLAAGPELSIKLNTFGHTNPLEVLQVFGFLIPGMLFVFCRGSQRLWIGLSVLAFSMFLCVELVYLHDAFNSRMNTIFKVYYQLWILIGLLCAVGWVHALQVKKIWRIVLLPSLLISLIPGLLYSGALSTQAWKQEHRSYNAWSVYSAEEQHFLRLAQKLILPGERIAEAPGISYDSTTSTLGTWTAGNTLLGWQGHQGQWRPDFTPPNLSAIYEAPSREALTIALLEMNVDWVALGKNEWESFVIHEEWEKWMPGLAYRVVDQPTQRLYRVK